MFGRLIQCSIQQIGIGLNVWVFPVNPAGILRLEGLVDLFRISRYSLKAQGWSSVFSLLSESSNCDKTNAHLVDLESGIKAR